MPKKTLQTHTDLLTPSECQDFIVRAESTGYLAMEGDYPPSYRDNDRIIIDDPALSKQMFAKFRHALPSRIEMSGQTWKLVGLNPRFRGCRYTNGQKFTRHRDGAHSLPDGSRSFLTLMLYLNDHQEFQGGQTRFYPDRWSTEASRSVSPQTGMGIVFDHSLWHDGQPVTEGVKYVLRTDVIYRPLGKVPHGHTGYVWTLVTLSDGRIVSGSRDKTVRVWQDGKETQVLHHHQASVTCLLSHDKQLWSGSRDRELAIWCDQGGGFRKQRSFRAHDGAVLSMIKLIGGHVATTGADNLVRFWDIDGNLRQEFATPSWPWTSCQAPDGSFFVACDDGQVLQLDLEDKKLKCRQRAPTGVLSLTVGLGGQLLAGCADGRIRRWQRYGHQLCDWVGHRGPVTSLATLPDGRILSGSEDDGVRIWNDGDSTEVVRHADFVRAVHPTNDGRGVVTASYDGSVRWSSLPCPTSPRAMAFTERAANPGGAISGTAVAS
jgi:predicted 2-oxoglutarate/Fe(II)-dependent dioxygenase YbiX